MLNTLRNSSIATILCSVIGGCTFMGLSDDLQQLDAAVVIQGEVVSGTANSAPVLVVLYKAVDNGKPKMDGYSVVYGNNNFRFLRGAGDYYLVAFEDSNENLTIDDDERIGWHGLPSLINAQPGTSFTDLPIELGAPDDAWRVLPKLQLVNEPPAIAVPTHDHVGKVVSMDDPRFSAEAGNDGLWSPVTFVRRGYHGIYFLEPYSAEKIPVLFVHGINASAGDWRYAISKLDRTRFQPWLVNYPSGMRLELISSALNQAVTQLRLQHQFDTLYVVAHSMGGLVAQRFINLNVGHDKQSAIKRFVSISTPWNGHESAASGVSLSPVVVPSWYDMVPGSEFVESLFAETSSESIPHFVLFSHRGTYSFLGEKNTDGVVSLRSQLPLHVQERAAAVIGFDEGHTSILSSPSMVEKLGSILAGSD